MEKLKLHESGTLVADEAAEGVFPIRIITEGEGSSGIYTREMLEANAPIFRAGTRSFIDHPKDPTKPWERSLNSLVGKLNENAHYKIDDDGVAGLYSDLKVTKPGLREWVRENLDIIELSIYSDAEGEKNADGKIVVERFVEDDPYRSVDLVVAAGRGGRFERAMESLREIENSTEEVEDGHAPAGRTTTSKENSTMELAELAEKVDKLSVALEAFVAASTPILESLKPAEVTEPITDDAVEAIAESGLPKLSRKVVLEAVRNGAVVEDAIKEQNEYIDSVREDLRVSEGYVRTTDAVTGNALDLGKVFG